jgi:hypothetical protein
MQEVNAVEQVARWGLLARQTTVAALVYLALLVAAAASTKISGGKEPALLVWIGASLALFVLLIRAARGSAVLTGPLLKGAAVTGVVAMIVAVLAFVGFVAMVNVWELLGLGH